MKKFCGIIKGLRSEDSGSAAVETALTFAFFLAPMLAYGVELYSFKTRTAVMNRESYQVAMILAGSPDANRTDAEIINTYRQTFPDLNDLINVTSYCACMSQLASYQPGDALADCENSCPPSERIIWKKVSITRTYTPLIDAKFTGDAKLKAAHLFRNS